MTGSPIISVIMPVYNCEKYVYESVQSILNQTYTDFELIIVDDCSTDSTVSIIEAIPDQRILLIQKEKNSGYTDSLNHAVTIAKGKFIARMDGDDISLPDRFQRQVDCLNANEDVILCGTGIQVIDSPVVLKHPVNHEDIKVKLCFSNSFFHPTIMARKQILLENNYNREFEPAEDYDLWTRLVFKGKLMNIDEVLLHYRVHANQVSNYKNDIQKNASAIAQLRMFQVLFENKIIDDKVFRQTFRWHDVNSIEEFKTAMGFYKEIERNNHILTVYKKSDFNSELKKIRVTFLKYYFVRQGFFIRHLKSYAMNISLPDFFAIINPFKKIKKKFA